MFFFFLRSGCFTIKGQQRGIVFSHPILSKKINKDLISLVFVENLLSWAQVYVFGLILHIRQNTVCAFSICVYFLSACSLCTAEYLWHIRRQLHVKEAALNVLFTIKYITYSAPNRYTKRNIHIQQRLVTIKGTVFRKNRMTQYTVYDGQEGKIQFSVFWLSFKKYALCLLREYA